MFIPLRHEQMEGRRLPVVSIALIAIIIIAFLATYWTLIGTPRPQNNEVRAHILLLAASHPELIVPDQVHQMIEKFKHDHPQTWSEAESHTRDVADAWDARVRLIDDPEALQQEMDALTRQWVQRNAHPPAIETYAFIPAQPTAISYLTANFMHGGWLHIIGNMWFLWLAGFVLEDVWGRWLYSVFYLLAGAAALQFYSWTNPGSITPTLGASGAVAALMGAFLVRFPKMKIEMAWLLFFRFYRFKAAAYW